MPSLAEDWCRSDVIYFVTGILVFLAAMCHVVLSVVFIIPRCIQVIAFLERSSIFMHTSVSARYNSAEKIAMASASNNDEVSTLFLRATTIWTDDCTRASQITW